MGGTANFWAAVAGPNAAAPGSPEATGGAGYWDQVRKSAPVAQNEAKPGVWQGFKETFAPTALGSQVVDAAKSGYRTIAHGTPEERTDLLRESLGPMKAVVPTAEEFETGAREGRNPMLLHASNLWHEAEAAPKAVWDARSQETAPRAFGQALGTGANMLLPGVGEEAPEAEGENFLARAASRLEAPKAVGIARRAVTGLRTTPEEIGEKASGRLIASATNRQSAIGQALRTAKQNVAPLYQNLHAADEAANPAGGIDLSHVDLEGVAKKAAGSARPLSQRESMAASMASRVMADGMSESDAKLFLKGQGYAPKQIDVIMGSATAPASAEEGGGYTLAKARALRAQAARGARTAERAGNHVEAARLNGTYAQITDAMKQRAADLDPSGGLLNDFERADAKWSDIRSAERTLGPLLEAKSGKYASPEGFQKAWSKLDSNQRRELQLLSRDAGLDLNALKAGGKAAGTVIRGMHPGMTPWYNRMLYGYLPAKVATGVGMGLLAGHEAGRRGLPKWATGLSYVLPMAAGYGGVGLIQPLLERGAAMEGIEGLPKELPRAGFGRETPSVPWRPPPTPEPGNRLLPEHAGGGPIVPDEILPPRRAGSIVTPEPGGQPLLRGQVTRSKFPSPMLPAVGETGEPGTGLPRRPIVPGERRALPPASAYDLAEARTPEHGIRTINGKIVPPEWAQPETATGESVPSKERVGATSAAAGNLREERARLAQLDKKYQMLSGRLERSRKFSTAQSSTRQLRAISDERNALRRKFGLSPQEGDVAEAQNPTATYDSLSDEARDSLDAWVKEIPHLPQSLREATMEELKRYGDAYTPLKERVARQYVEYEQKKAAGQAGTE